MTHYCDVIMGAMLSKITSLTIVYSTVFQAQIKENIKALRNRPLCEGFTGEFPAQMASNAENVFIWWRHHAQSTKPMFILLCCCRKWRLCLFSGTLSGHLPWLPLNLWYKLHKIIKLKCFSYRLAVVFVQILWSQMLSREWRLQSNYIWVINKFFAH